MYLLYPYGYVFLNLICQDYSETRRNTHISRRGEKPHPFCVWGTRKSQEAKSASSADQWFEKVWVKRKSETDINIAWKTCIYLNHCDLEANLNDFNNCSFVGAKKSWAMDLWITQRALPWVCTTQLGSNPGEGRKTPKWIWVQAALWVQKCNCNWLIWIRLHEQEILSD